MSHDNYELFARPYLLGLLTHAERLSYQAHLTRCQPCRSGLEELTPLPALLMGLPQQAYLPADRATPGPN